MKTQTDLLAALRERRNFKVDNYIEKKVAAINKFFKDEFLDAAVVGLSGGVDSSVVLALLLEAQKQECSPIKEIVPVIVPINGMGTSGQDEAKFRAIRLCRHFNVVFKHVYGGKAYSAILKEFADDPSYTDSWAKGQMASILRVPIFYFQAALLQSRGRRSIVAGTINKSEGSFIGFWGKYSDGAVDCQIISDIYKHEVYLVATALGVTKEIINIEPRGDVYSGETDEELIGVSYDFLDSYLMMKEFNISPDDLLLEGSLLEFQRNASLLEERHLKNQHKYKNGKGFAKFLDVIYGPINGGWE